MRKTISGKHNITLFLRVPKEEAVRIIGRCWAKGLLSDKQYIKKLEDIDQEEALKFAKKRNKLSKALDRCGFIG